jgi:hypothetical protein
MFCGSGAHHAGEGQAEAGQRDRADDDAGRRRRPGDDDRVAAPASSASITAIGVKV